jgi:hypothetical protein
VAAESVFFVFGLVGALAGYIVGDLQRELRWRRDARANLAQAVDRLTVPHSVPVGVTDRGTDAVGTSPNGNGDSDGGPLRSLGSIRDGQARRRAVSRPDFRDRPGVGLPVGPPRVTNAPSVGRRRFVDYDCG